MTKIQTIKLIRKIDDFIGLPRAIGVYNYLSCFGTVTVTENDIYGYFEGKWRDDE